MSIEWKGPQDGLPPVGDWVLYGEPDGEVSKVFIAAHHIDGDHAIFTDTRSGVILYHGVAGDFRPIQSERDKLLAMAVEVCQSSFKVEAIEDISRMLYDAGMLVDPERKPMSRYAAGQLLSEEFGLNSTVYFDSINLVLDALGYKD